MTRRDESVPSPASNDELLARAAALEQQAREILAGLDLAALVADAGPLLLVGSFVSGLMCWPELDVMVHVGADFSPRDVRRLATHIVGRTGAIAVEYHDKRVRGA